MATFTVSLDRPAGRQPGRLRQRAKTAVSAVAGLGASLVRPHRASLARLADMPLTVLGTAGIDFAAFHVTHGLGWLVTGISLFVVEHMIADDEDTGRSA